MPPEQCEKHDGIMTRLFTTLEANSKEQAVFITEVKAYIKTNDEFVKKADKVIFGDERGNGLITQLKVAVKHINIQWTLIILILTGIVGLGIKIALKG